MKALGRQAASVRATRILARETPKCSTSSRTSRRAMSARSTVAGPGDEPQSWSLPHFTLWSEREAGAEGTRYQVLHLSTPHLREIATPS
jgi:hypothetical protein